MVSFVSARTSESAMEFLRVGRRKTLCVLVLNQYVTVECNQSICMIKTRNYTFLS